MKNYRKMLPIALTVGAALFVSSAFAAVTPTQGLGTNWIGSPTLTLGGTGPNGVPGNPDAFFSAENNFGGSGTFSAGQTFKAPISGTLTRLQLFVSGGPVTETILMYDLGAASGYTGVSGASIDGALNPISGLNAGTKTNMFTVGLTFDYGGGGANVITLDFTGDDAISMTAGDLYYFRIVQPTATALTWYRTGSDVYADGAAYRQNGTINGNPARDFALAATIVAVPEPTTIALASLGGVLLLFKRQRRHSK